ncbi:MAG: hypothetical protein ACLS6W_00160 [Ruminococcus sp.]
MEANQTQTAAFADLSLSAETIAELQTYLLAVANYYHILPIEKLYSILCEQNPEFLSKEDFLSFLQAQKTQPTCYQILKPGELFEGVPANLNLLWNGMLVHECLLVDQDECYAFLEFSEGKPYHVPEKELLLQYANEEFYEETPEVTAMRAVFADMGMSPTKQENELLEVLVFARENAELPEVFDDIQRRQLTFNDRTLRNLFGTELAQSFAAAVDSGCTPVNCWKSFRKCREILYGQKMSTRHQRYKSEWNSWFRCCNAAEAELADFMQSQIALKRCWKMPTDAS